MKTLSELIADTRATHDIRNILGLSKNDRVIVCPLPQHAHKKNTPSFSIFWRGGKQWWRCHGSCDMEGDVVDLVGFMRVNGYDKRNPDKIREAVNLLDDRFEITVPVPEKEVMLSGREYLKFLPPGDEVIEYAATRGLTPETLTVFKVGQSGHYMTIPLFEEGVLKGIKMRNIWKCDPKYRFFQMEGSRLGLFNYDRVEFRTGAVFVVKGEIPAMLLHQMGYVACAPTAGEGSYKGQVFRWNTALALASKVIVGDNDEPGRVLGKKRAMLFGGTLVFPPDTYKDIDQFILAEPEQSRETIQRWIEQALAAS